jgi:hypothetical protein
VIAADVRRVGGVARLELELAGSLGDLLEDEVGIEPDSVLVLERLAGLDEHVDRLGEKELDPDLGHQPAPAAIDDVHRLFAEDLVAGHRVHEQGGLLAFGGWGSAAPGWGVDLAASIRNLI